MRKNINKILLVIVMIVSIIGIVLTINHAKNNLNNNMMPDMQQMGENPPEFNNSFNPDDNPPDNNGMPQMENPNMEDNAPMDMNRGETALTMPYIITIGVFSTLFSISLLYLFMSIKNKRFYQNKDKLTIYILSNIIVIAILTTSVTTITNKMFLTNTPINREETSKDQVVLDESHVVEDNQINLNERDSDITITKGGTYTFEGSFNHSIIVNTDNQEVEIILNGVTITNDNTAAIIGLSASKITIHLADETTNKLSDGGNSEYDGCIFSNAELIFKGNGTLEVNGNQNEGEGIATEAKNMTFDSGTYIITSNDDGINAGGDGATITINGGTFYINASGDGIDSNQDAILNGGTIFVIGSDVGADAGIDTDDGYVINGGTVVALGTDMIETPKDTSTQKTIAFTLDQTINKDTIVTLMQNNQSIISFEAPKSFRTIIISSNEIVDGEYSLYTGGFHDGTLVNGIYESGNYQVGDKVIVNNSDTFTVSQIVNLFGNEKGRH